jgi:1-phosphatidylinositol-4-phosphate 5-kinase
MDSEFLRKQNIMDYSLLLVIESGSDMKETRNRYTNGQQVFHFGIIDFLQDWNISKRLENRYKRIVKLKKGEATDLSAIEPNLYQKRFSEFLSKHVLRENLIK